MILFEGSDATMSKEHYTPELAAEILAMAHIPAHIDEMKRESRKEFTDFTIRYRGELYQLRDLMNAGWRVQTQFTLSETSKPACECFILWRYKTEV